MIEISHQQAERLISQQFDQLLSDEEWNALQYHLECCPNCQRFHRRFEHMERRLHQSLQARWGSVSGPSRKLPKQVSKLHAVIEDRRAVLSTSAIGGVEFLFILFIMIVQGQSGKTATGIPHPLETVAITTPAALPTAVPLIHPGQFPHVIAYESNFEGNAEIYLLSPGFTPVNLTQNPAEDRFPTWSPDGEWLAFLSNRSTPDQENNKNELYVMSVAGNQLVQMTSESLIDWEGPLSWSADGKWIAAEAVLHGVSRQRYIAIVGVDGTGPSLLLDKPNGTQPKFAPYGNRLAFFQKAPERDRLIIYHIDTGSELVEDIPPSNSRLAETDVSFDWPADGDGLYYTPSLPPTYSIQPTMKPKCSRLVIQLRPNDEPWYEKLRDHFHRAISETDGAIHSISWAPDKVVIYVADSTDPNTALSNSGSAENHFSFLNHHTKLSNNLNGLMDLCVQSGLDRGSWSLDMHWLVLNAYEASTPDPGLYAIRMPGVNLSWQISGAAGIQDQEIPVGSIFRLSTTRIITSLPRIRPFRERMSIQPRSGKRDTIRSDSLRKAGQIKQPVPAS